MLHVPPRDPSDPQFRTPELPDEPRITSARVLAGLAVAGLIIGVGYVLRSELFARSACSFGSGPSGEEVTCPAPVGSQTPLAAWYFVGIFLGGLVVAWPWVRRAVHRALKGKAGFAAIVACGMIAGAGLGWVIGSGLGRWATSGCFEMDCFAFAFWQSGGILVGMVVGTFLGAFWARRTSSADG